MLSKKVIVSLRGKGQLLSAKYQIGVKGITPTLIKSIQSGLKKNELIKISLMQPVAQSINEFADILVKETDSTLIEIKGHTFLLYKKNEDKKKETKKRL